IPLPHRVKSPPEQYAVSVRFGIAEGPAVFRVLLRSAPPVGVSWRMAYTMETSRTTIACLLVEYSSSWQNNMATNCPQLLKPRACRSALCLRAAVSNPVREMSCKICEKMLHTLFKAESSSDWLVFANSTYQRLSAFFFPKAIRSAELIWTRMDRDTRFRTLVDQLRALIAWKWGQNVIFTRLDPDDPYPPLVVNESEMVMEARCTSSPCTTLSVEMQERTARRIKQP